MSKTINVKEYLVALRREMQESHLDAFIIPSQDPHQSEYVADHWKARAWLSGFTGSAGVAVVTADHAGLWTDSRYFIQAEQELKGGPFELHPLKVPHAPEHIDWLLENLPQGSTVGCDGNIFSVAQVNHLRRKLGNKGIRIAYQEDLIGRIWKGRPPLPRDPAFELEESYAGQSRAEKIGLIRQRMKRGEYYLVATLDDIAWALNIRGADVEYNPVCISYLLAGHKTVYWFVHKEKVPAELRQRLKEDGVQLRPYEEMEAFLKELDQDSPVLYDPDSTSINLYEALEEEQWKSSNNLIRPMKAIKNETEVKHIREAMRKDGVALLKLYRWLEAELQNRTVSEYELAQQLAAFRKAQGNYFGESFAAIVGYAANGAIVHYKPEPDTCAAIRPEGILLLDSGGQYRGGTTDITRTTAFGDSTQEQRRNYTLVLKGHIALSRAVFPEGTAGVQLDILARMHLWREGLNYGHGTGHGVGFFLNVHEAPQGFTPNPRGERGETAFLPGMLTSNEPGYYKSGEYGIRIENLELCVEQTSGESGRFFAFEPLTLFPIDLKLAETELLTQEEKGWLNDYHRKVLKELTPLLNDDEHDWLAEKCRSV
ncbi:MAG: aminopeptidase P family protein [Lewinellaceae bacterium]|nr:aminopeptidase P family protein [Phaeodactylibacter sp.]MCB9347633.1 aminopeptidase P family protein [Lewinellaceae bacterium]